MASTHTAPVNLPRVAITYCTQCRWMLRAAYFGQELLSTFGTQIGEIALRPATGGLFTVELTYLAQSEDGSVHLVQVLLWDRKAEGGFPETKVLKQRVRDHIDPGKNLGHSDVHGKKKAITSEDKQEDKSEDKFEAKQEAKSEDKPEDKPEDKLEAKAESQTQELSNTNADDGIKRNPDGTVCEDCR